jgi:hypothetical protein
LHFADTAVSLCLLPRDHCLACCDPFLWWEHFGLMYWQLLLHRWTKLWQLSLTGRQRFLVCCPSPATFQGSWSDQQLFSWFSWFFCLSSLVHSL